jgi:hypothetical protein
LTAEQRVWRQFGSLSRGEKEGIKIVVERVIKTMGPSGWRVLAGLPTAKSDRSLIYGWVVKTVRRYMKKEISKRRVSRAVAACKRAEFCWYLIQSAVNNSLFKPQAV